MEPGCPCFLKLAPDESEHQVRLGNMYMGQWISELEMPQKHLGCSFEHSDNQVHLEAIIGTVHLRCEWAGIIRGSCNNADSGRAGLERGPRFSLVMLLLRVSQDQIPNLWSSVQMQKWGPLYTRKRNASFLPQPPSPLSRCCLHGCSMSYSLRHEDAHGVSPPG